MGGGAERGGEGAGGEAGGALLSPGDVTHVGSGSRATGFPGWWRCRGGHMLPRKAPARSRAPSPPVPAADALRRQGRSPAGGPRPRESNRKGGNPPAASRRKRLRRWPAPGRPHRDPRLPPPRCRHPSNFSTYGLSRWVWGVRGWCPGGSQGCPRRDSKPKDGSPTLPRGFIKQEYA